MTLVENQGLLVLAEWVLTFELNGEWKLFSYEVCSIFHFSIWLVFTAAMLSLALVLRGKKKKNCSEIWPVSIKHALLMQGKNIFLLSSFSISISYQQQTHLFYQLLYLSHYLVAYSKKVTLLFQQRLFLLSWVVKLFRFKFQSNVNTRTQSHWNPNAYIQIYTLTPDWSKSGLQTCLAQVSPMRLNVQPNRKVILTWLIIHRKA